jgi:hypothetical protein
VLNQTFAQQELLPARTAGELATLPTSRQTKDGATSPLFGMMVLSDSSYRPCDAEEQQEYYSGKQKCHTLKNPLAIDETCQICCLSATYEGKANEKSPADLEGIACPQAVISIKI